jgi:hypothetical protein
VAVKIVCLYLAPGTWCDDGRKSPASSEPDQVTSSIAITTCIPCLMKVRDFCERAADRLIELGVPL